MQYSQDYDEMMIPFRWSWDGGANSSRMTFPALVQPYIKSVQLFKCPSNSSTGNVNDTPRPEYGIPAIPRSYMANAGDTGGNGPGTLRPMKQASDGPVSLASFNNVAQTIIVTEHKDNPYIDLYTAGTAEGLQGHLGTTNFLFADGHVKSMRPAATSVNTCMWTMNLAASDTATAPTSCNPNWTDALSRAEKTNS
jgi:prepilin-type processing-associated H-X9-DG protein